MDAPIIQEVEVKSVLSKSNLPVCEYSVNPYVGCPHACQYCYANFMKRFTNHPEPWGDFLDVKYWPIIKNPQKYAGKELFIDSVTDPYNPEEKTYGRTRAGAGAANKGLDDHSSDYFVLHLRMTGCLLLTPANYPEEKHTHIVFHLSSGDELRFSHRGLRAQGHSADRFQGGRLLPQLEAGQAPVRGLRRGVPRPLRP